MVMMKRVFAILAAALVMAACGGKDNPEPEVKKSVTGCWELSNVTTKATVGSVTVNVYVEFKSDKTFVLYQKLGEGRFTVFTGTYKYENDQLLGTYTNSSSWGPYSATVSDSSLTLTTAGGKEVDTYKKITSIPDNVKNNTY